MEKYTFVFEYKRGTYIKQIESGNLKEALKKWSKLINISEIAGFDSEKLEQLQKEIQNEAESPRLLDGMDDVWCLFLRIGYSSHLLNIIATKQDAMKDR